jgi:hypothetical protein
MEGREGAPDSPYLTDNLKDYPVELNLLYTKTRRNGLRRRGDELYPE